VAVALPLVFEKPQSPNNITTLTPASRPAVQDQTLPVKKSA